MSLSKSQKICLWERDVLVGVPNWVTLADPRVDWFESCISQKCCATTWIVLTHSGVPRSVSFVGSSESGQWSHVWDSFLFIIKKKNHKALTQFDSLVKPNLCSILNSWARDSIQVHYPTCIKAYYQVHLIWTNGLSSHLIKGLLIYEFIFQTHIKLINEPINELKPNLFFIKLYCSQAYSWTIVFIRLFIKEAKINAQLLACS